MISEILIYDPIGTKPVAPCFSDDSYYVREFATFKELARYMITRNSYTLSSHEGKLELVPNTQELDLFHNIVVILNSADNHSDTRLTFAEKVEMLKFRFHHLNLSVVHGDFAGMDLDKLVAEIEHKSDVKNGLLKDRLPRIKAWVGLSDISPECLHTIPAFLKCCEANTVESMKLRRRLVNVLGTHFNFLDMLSLPHEHNYYEQVVYQWGFPAHNLTVDELLYCGFVMLKITFRHWYDQDRENYPIFQDENFMLNFLFHIRDNYRLGNPFHNFRHAIDVMQASFYFVTKIIDLSKQDGEVNNQLSKQLMEPATCSLLLVASLGHDIGHPGITNAFLSSHNTFVAKYFDDQSILENFHQTQFCSLLQVYANSQSTFPDSKPHKFIRDCIIATDMGKHDFYTAKIGEFLPKDAKFASRDAEHEATTTLCSLLIKCADISNVCRPLPVSVKWGVSLNQEFAEVAALEKLLKDESAPVSVVKVPAVPVKELTPDSATQLMPSLSGSQLFFIDRFANNYFTQISESLPVLNFLGKELAKNSEFWSSI